MVRVHQGSPENLMYSNKYLQNNFKKFICIYKDRPIKYNKSGMKIEHCYALYLYLKKIKPKTVIESGIWKGQTTWLIKKILPNVKLFSIDIDLSQRVFIDENVKYLSKDISNYSWKNVNKKSCLIIFDDHVCFSKRINFLLKKKFKHIIFDDNLPNNFIGYYTPKMIIEKSKLIHRENILYFNIKRIFIFLINLIFLKKFNTNYKINFKINYVEIIKFDKSYINKIKLFNKLEKKIISYYEFPPLLKFDLKKRFMRIIKKFKFNVKNFKYNVKDPIFNQSNRLLNKDDLKKEISIQYGNICYIKLK